MADIQKYFEEFHDNIKIDSEADILRGKKEIVIEKIKNYFKIKKLPSFDDFLQGSFKYKVGIKPINDLEYDIDIGIEFSFDYTEYDSTEVRDWIKNAVKDHTDKIEIKGPCTRVYYAQGFHLDIVVYAQDPKSKISDLKLAHISKGWISANPKKMARYVLEQREGFKGTESGEAGVDQLRRTVRYLKRWYDILIPYESSDKPSGISFLLLAIKYLSATLNWKTNKSDDLQCLINFIEKILFMFPDRIVIDKPTPEYEDVFLPLSDKAMKNLKENISVFLNALKASKDTLDINTSCQKMQEIFGKDFPLPPKDENTEKTKSPAIVPSSTSA